MSNKNIFVEKARLLGAEQLAEDMKLQLGQCKEPTLTIKQVQDYVDNILHQLRGNMSQLITAHKENPLGD